MRDDGKPDTLTLVAIAVVAYALSTAVHEGIGHGATTVFLGGRVNYVSSVACACDGSMLSPWAQRLINAGGTLSNLGLGLLAFALLHTLRGVSPAHRFFWWLMGTINLFIGGGYLMVPTLIGFGDWMGFLSGLPAHWLWRSDLILSGVLISFAALFPAMGYLEPFLPAEPPQRGRSALRLTLIPYLTGGILLCLAGLFNPEGMVLVAISAAAASFGGTAFLAWLPVWLRWKPPAKDSGSVTLERSWGWIAAGAVVAVLFVVLLGPSVRSQQ